MATETQTPVKAGKQNEAQAAAAGAETETTAAAAAAAVVAGQDKDLGGTAAGALAAAADPAQVVSMAQEAGLGQFAADWISGGLTLGQVEGKIAFASKVADQCEAAGIDVGQFMSTGGDPEKLLSLAVTHAAAAAAGEHIDNSVAAQTGDDKDAGWGKAFESTNKRKF